MGVGNIGTAVIRRLHGFGCRVLASSNAGTAAAAADFVSLDELLRESDVVTLHLPLNAETHHLIGREQIETMKQGAFLINTGRGALVDTDALIVALEAGSWAARRWTCSKARKGLFYFDCTNRPIDHPSSAAAATAAERDRHTAHGLLHRAGVARHRRTDPDQVSELRDEAGRMTRRPTIAILFGGCSEEHDVSVKSAMEVAASIDTQKYDPIYIGITKTRRLEDVRAAAPGMGRRRLADEP